VGPRQYSASRLRTFVANERSSLLIVFARTVHYNLIRCAYSISLI
jgi:hypothetical protein